MSVCIRSTHLLLLPGMMCDGDMWREQVDSLSSDVAISVGDIGGADSVEALAQSILEQAPEHFALAGLSMGGIIALEMWRQAPQRIERLALLDTNHHADLPERRDLRLEQIERVVAGELETVLRDELKPNYLADCHRNNLALLDTVLAMGLAQGPEVFARQSLALRNRPDSDATLLGIDCPTLVLCGDEDELCTPAVHEYMASRIPGATLVIVPECGHLSTMEQPQRVSAALHNWLCAA